MIDEVDQALIDNAQIAYANLASGSSVPEAVNELLKELRPAPAAPPVDDDIPF
jgi:hypothetical protein